MKNAEEDSATIREPTLLVPRATLILRNFMRSDGAMGDEVNPDTKWIGTDAGRTRIGKYIRV
jgi:hypothetical protein